MCEADEDIEILEFEGWEYPTDAVRADNVWSHPRRGRLQKPRVAGAPPPRACSGWTSALSEENRIHHGLAEGVNVSLGDCADDRLAGFAQEKVRDFVKTFVRGYLENYDLDGVDKLYFGTYVGGGGYMPQHFLVGGWDFYKTTGVNPAHPIALESGATHRFELIVDDDFAAARRKGREPRITVQVLTDLPGDVLPRVTVGGHALEGGSAKDGIATFPADDALFVKGVNDVEITVPEATTLRDFAMRVRF